MRLRVLLYLVVITIVVASSGCFGIGSGNPTPVPTGTPQGSSSSMTYTYTDADLTKGKSDSAALLKNATDALDRNDLQAFLGCLSDADRAGAQGYTFKSGEAEKLSAGLKGAQITQAYPEVIYYTMTIDSAACEFSTIREGVSAWKLYGL